jgi:hypothetical protein
MIERQTGRTAQQMLDAPNGAVFVWCNSRVHYAHALANKVGRGDLLIRPLSWLTPSNVMACQSSPAVVVDHAAPWSAGLMLALLRLKERGATVVR